mgnify:CR=1 FL=1
MAINRSESVDIGNVMGLVTLLVVGPLVYFVIANRGEEKKIEDYLLLGALYIEAYINNKLFVCILTKANYLFLCNSLLLLLNIPYTFF